MGMKIWYSIFLHFLFLATLTQAQQPDCKPVRCSSSGPNISFPFYLKGQSQECGIPGFGLICRSDTTTIKFPSHGDLVLTSISYRDRRLDLLDPRNCVHEVFLNLNLSQTPFKYYYSLKSYTYVNCSEPENPWRYQLLEIPCLSGPGYHVYTIEGSRAALEVANQDRPSSCKVVKTVDIPFPYSPYLSDNSFGLRLTWELADSCGGCKGRGSRGNSIIDRRICLMFLFFFYPRKCVFFNENMKYLSCIRFSPLPSPLFMPMDLLSTGKKIIHRRKMHFPHHECFVEALFSLPCI